jgi:hypothetical protein
MLKPGHVMLSPPQQSLLRGCPRAEPPGRAGAAEPTGAHPGATETSTAAASEATAKAASEPAATEGATEGATEPAAAKTTAEPPEAEGAPGEPAVRRLLLAERREQRLAPAVVLGTKVACGEAAGERAEGLRGRVWVCRVGRRRGRA